MLCENKGFIMFSVLHQADPSVIGKVVLFHCSNMLHMHLITSIVTFLHGRKISTAKLWLLASGLHFRSLVKAIITW